MVNKNINIKGYVFCLLCTCFLSVQANEIEEPDLYDFAYGYEIIPDHQAPIIRVPMPGLVYKKVARPDMGDIRVFNKNGERVPYAILKQKSESRTEKIITDLPFFPLYSPVKQGDITLAEDGTIQQIIFRDNAYQQENATINSYLIDLSGVKQGIDMLEFDLTGYSNGYIKRVKLERSEDLNRWFTQVSQATLSDLDYSGHQLKKNSILMHGKKPTYLRLTWLDEVEGIQISAIRATLKSTTRTRPLNWSRVMGVVSEDDDHIYEFDTGGRYRIHAINIRLPEHNSLIEGSIRSAKTRDKKTPWRTHYHGLFYHLTIQDAALEGDPITIRNTLDRYWQLEVNSIDGMGNQPPELEFAWQADELYFIPRGDGPYTLAFGNPDVLPPKISASPLMKQLDVIQDESYIQGARIGKQVTLQGESALKADLDIPWQRILLWTLLVVGVLTLAVMAFRLFKQMQTPL